MRCDTTSCRLEAVVVLRRRAFPPGRVPAGGHRPFCRACADIRLQGSSQLSQLYEPASDGEELLFLVHED